MLNWGLLFGGCGLIVKYQIGLPYSFGLITWQVPAFVLQMSLLTGVGIFLVGSWGMMHSRFIFTAVAAFTAVDAFVGLMTFSKTDVLLPIIMIGLASLNRNVPVWRAALVTGLLITVFTTTAPIVDYGRNVLLQRYDSITGAGFEERLDIIEAYFQGGEEQFLADPTRSRLQGSLARLSYMNQSAFAVHLYDSNLPGDSLSAIGVVLIPRFLWPDKPDLNYLGAGFTRAATGSSESLSWPGRYAEVYWNWGWWGLFFLLPPLGIVYALLSRYALWVFVSERWVYFPVVLLAMRYGIDIGGSYAASGVGGLLNIIVFHFGAKLCEMTAGSAFSLRWSPRAAAQGGPRRA